MCMEAKDCNLRARVDAIDDRLTKVEDNMTTGFNTVTDSVNQLAHDFGVRMNTIDAKLVEEKVKWGDTLRRIVLWSAGTLLAGAAVAMGVTIIKNILTL